MSQRRDAWMRQAQSDFDVGALTQAKEFHSQACYHYSQAAEKALKGLLISLGTLPPDSHSLDRLAEAIREQGLDTTALEALHLKALSRMNSETRYPRDDEAPWIALIQTTPRWRKRPPKPSYDLSNPFWLIQVKRCCFVALSIE